MKEEILRLRAEGKSYREIMEILGCSKGTISYHVGPGQKIKTLAKGKQTKARRREEIAKLKNYPCADCKGTFPPECMDFDHISGTKIAAISTLINTAPWPVVLAELEKCELVCANCHRIRSKERSVGTLMVPVEGLSTGVAI